MLKLLYGTAYRTPFAKQLLEEEEPDLEEISSINAQAAWRPSKRAGVAVSGFLSSIENHILEDPYAGLSEPNHQDIRGVEIEGHLSPAKSLDFSANLTLIDNSGPDETYHSFLYIEPGPGGIWVPVYEDRTYPYDTGPTSLFNLTGTWRPVEKVTAFARLGYFSSRQLIYPKGETFRSSPSVWLLDVSATIRDIVFPGLQLQVSVKNLFDKDYETPGTYRTIEGEPLTVEVVLRKRW